MKKRTFQAVCCCLFIVLFLSVTALQAQKDKEKPLDTLKPSLNPQTPPPLQALPDLIVERIVLGPECRVDVLVANRGLGAVPDAVWTTHTPQSSSVYIHVDGNSWGGQTIWHFDPTKSLQRPGGMAVYKSGYKVLGTQTIRATIDHTAQVAEANEGNNEKTERLTCREGGRPGPDRRPVPGPDPRPVSRDLTVRIANCPQTVRPGQNLTGAFQVTAVNTAPTSSVNDIFMDLVLRSDPNCPSPASLAVYSPHYSNGVLLQGGRTNISLAAAETKPVTTLGGVIPTDTPPGTYFLCAVIDSGNKVREDDENNNCACCRLQVEARPPVDMPPAEVLPPPSRKIIK